MHAEYTFDNFSGLDLDGYDMNTATPFTLPECFLCSAQVAARAVSLRQISRVWLVQTTRFLNNITIVTFPIAGTYIEAFSFTSGPQF